MNAQDTEALIKYQNILSAMILGKISREEGRKRIDALNETRTALTKLQGQNEAPRLGRFS